jgi:uncharacterized protein YoxC
MCRRTSVALIALATALIIAGCSQSQSDTNALCDAKDNFAASVQTLKEVDVVKEGTSALRAALEQVQADGQAFMKEAKSSYGAEVNDLETSLSQLGTALRQVGSDQSQPVASAAAELQTSASALIDKVQASDCS